MIGVNMDQATLLRKMSGIQRLEQAFQLSDLVRELAIKNITSGKKLSKNAIRKELAKRISLVS